MATIKHTKSNSRRNFFIMIGVVGFFFLMNTFGLIPVADIGRDLTRPGSSWLTSAGRRVGNIFNEIGNLGTLNNKNQELSEENTQLKKEISVLRELESENKKLRAELKFPDKKNQNSIGADVIGYQPDNVRQLLQVNRGSNDGLKTGQVVIVEGNLVGKVRSVSAHAASILLITDANFRVLVIDQKTGAPGIAAGQIGGSVNMERIPRDKTVRVGDTIVTSGLDGEFPSGIIVGEVNEVNQPGESIFNTARLTLPFEPSQLRLVRIITGE